MGSAGRKLPSITAALKLTVGNAYHSNTCQQVPTGRPAGRLVHDHTDMSAGPDRQAGRYRVIHACMAARSAVALMVRMHAAELHEAFAAMAAVRARPVVMLMMLLTSALSLMAP